MLVPVVDRVTPTLSKDAERINPIALESVAGEPQGAGTEGLLPPFPVPPGCWALRNPASVSAFVLR